MTDLSPALPGDPADGATHALRLATDVRATWRPGKAIEPVADMDFEVTRGRVVTLRARFPPVVRFVT